MPEESLAPLAECPEVEAQYEAAVAYWLLGQEDQALRRWRLLAEGGHGPATQLMNWLQGHRRLPVDWFGPAPEGAPGDLLKGVGQDDRFELLQLGYEIFVEREPLPCQRGIRPPLYTVFHMLEWAGLPSRVGQLPGRVFGFTSDFDLHAPQLEGAFRAVDALVVLDGTEWSELADAVPTPCFTQPLALGLAEGCESWVPWGNRPHGVLISGTQTHHHHPDKALLAHRVLTTLGPEVLAFHGWLEQDEYRRVLANSRVTYTHYRRPGGTVTRGLEALGAGLGVAVQEESILRLFFGALEGLLPYRNEDPEDLLKVLRALLDRPVQEAEHASRLGAQAVRRRFSLERAGSHVARMLLVRAAELEAPRAVLPPSQLAPQRMVLSRGWRLDAASKGDAFDECMRLWGGWEHHPEAEERHRMGNALLREGALRLAELMGIKQISALPSPLLRRQAAAAALEHPDLQAFAQGLGRIVDHLVQAFPRRLCLRFNAFRVRWLLQSPNAFDWQAEAQWVLAQDPNVWELSPHDDPMAWDLWSHAFDYRGWVDAAWRWRQGRATEKEALRSRLLGGFAYLLAEDLSQDAQAYKVAHDLVPEFDPYSLALAEALVAQGGDWRVLGASILSELSGGSTVWPTARARLGEVLVGWPEVANLLPHHPPELRALWVDRVRDLERF